MTGEPPIQSDHGPAGLDYRFDCKPDFSFLTVRIPAGETLKVEASSMATMDTNIKMKTKLKGGFGRVLSGEKLFINEFTAENSPGEIGIAPGSSGDMDHVHLRGSTIFLQNSAYVCSTPDVNLETKWQGFVKGFFSGNGLFLIKCSGSGDLWFSTYGAMIPIEVDGEYVVDNHYVVAFEETLEYTVGKVGGYKSLFFSEGLVCHFRGRGRLWIQTRQVPSFSSWINPFRPSKKSK